MAAGARPTLAVAATLTDLRVGTWVYASPLRPARNLAREAHSLSVLTEGRFEIGIGAGRPGIEDELRELGMPVLTPGQRLADVRDAVTLLRELDGPDRRTPVVMAVRGPKARALATDRGGHGRGRDHAGRLPCRHDADRGGPPVTSGPRARVPRDRGRRCRLAVHATA